jgi:hypothetical protein
LERGGVAAKQKRGRCQREKAEPTRSAGGTAAQTGGIASGGAGGGATPVRVDPVP